MRRLATRRVTAELVAHAFRPVEASMPFRKFRTRIERRNGAAKANLARPEARATGTRERPVESEAGRGPAPRYTGPGSRDFPRCTTPARVPPPRRGARRRAVRGAHGFDQFAGTGFLQVNGLKRDS